MKWIKAEHKDLVNMGSKHWRDAKTKTPISAGTAFTWVRDGRNVVEWLDETPAGEHQPGEEQASEYEKLNVAFETNKEQFMELAAHAKDLESSLEAKEKEIDGYKLALVELSKTIDNIRQQRDYWKQRCEAAEYLLNGYRWEYPLTDNDFDKWQQLKNQKEQ